MKAVICDPRQGGLRHVELNTPSIEDGEALIRVRVVGICGTDVALASGKMKTAKLPVVPGHEIIGDVVEVCQGRDDLKGKRVAIEPTISCGECVACRLGYFNVCVNLKVLGVHADGGFAEYVKVPANKLHLLPDSMADMEAVLIEPVAVAVHVVRRAGLEVGEKALVVGAGPIGLCIAQVCRAAGVLEVVLAEVNDSRAAVAKEMGFSVLAAGRAGLSEPRSYDVAFEASGSLEGMFLAMEAVRPRGRIVVVGLAKELVPVDLSEVLFRELEIRGSRVYSFGDFARAIGLILRGDIRASQMVTDVVSLSEVERGIELAKGEPGVIKVAIKVG